ncbi:MAG: hypothetical protein HZC36_12615 [Armatimonadetes bacterium]|nr:hypothetical protein [Armatimonadota bacterium]
MATNEPTVKPDFWEKLNKLPSFWLYLILMATLSLALLPTAKLKNAPKKPNIALFTTLMSIPEGSTVLIHSDWTNSTRGENAGQMEALLRLLMRRKIKFAVASIGDARAPQVAKDTIRRINEERQKNGEQPYRKWEDYVEAGFFANVEGTLNAMSSNLQTAWAGKTDIKPGSGPTNIFESPVLRNVKKIENAALVIDVHASDVAYKMIERLNGKVPLASMCTGVMGPETLNYFAAGQLKGVCVGLDGVVGFETMMENGIEPDEFKAIDEGKVPAPGFKAIEGFKGQKNLARGMNYYMALHAGLVLLVLAVALGNIGMFMGRRKKTQ